MASSFFLRILNPSARFSAPIKAVIESSLLNIHERRNTGKSTKRKKLLPPCFLRTCAQKLGAWWWSDEEKSQTRKQGGGISSSGVVWPEFILDSADASVTVQSDGLSLVFIWYPNQLCAQKDAERQRCAAPKGVWIKWRYKKLTHLRCHCHRSTGTNQDPGRTRCTGYPLFLELLVRFWVNELRWTCLLYSRKKLSLKVSDCKVN